jgi:hypothetical protein
LLLSSLGPDTLQAIQQAAKIVSDIEKWKPSSKITSNT